MEGLNPNRSYSRANTTNTNITQHPTGKSNQSVSEEKPTPHHATITKKGEMILNVLEKCPTLTLYRGGWGSADEKRGILNDYGPVFVSKAMSAKNTLTKVSRMFTHHDEPVIVFNAHNSYYKSFPKPQLSAHKREREFTKYELELSNQNIDDIEELQESYIESGHKKDELARANHAKASYKSAENKTKPSKYISATYSLQNAKQWASQVIYKFTPDIHNVFLGNENENEILVLGGSSPHNVEVSVNNGNTFMSLEAYKAGVKQGTYQ